MSAVSRLLDNYITAQLLKKTDYAFKAAWRHMNRGV